MTTRAKISYGYVDFHGFWRFEETFVVIYDGYPENIIPLLREGNTDKFEEMTNFHDFGGTDYIYYVDDSNKNKIRCTVLEFDWDFYNNFGVENYKIVEELIL